MSKTKYVYIVKRWQPDEDYLGIPIYIYTKEEDAIQAARNLNKTYGDNCIFSLDGDFELVLNEEYYHYYEVERCIFDNHIPEQEKYYEYFVISVSGITYVAKDTTITTHNLMNAMQFDTWDQARAMIEVLEKANVYNNETLTVRGVNHIL